MIGMIRNYCDPVNRILGMMKFHDALDSWGLVIPEIFSRGNPGVDGAF
jgi:hypothetical protein